LFRRVELIDPDHNLKHGLCGLSQEQVIDAWINKLRGPKRSIPPNAKFYFTELGWKEVGRQVIAACQQVGQAYRVIKVKEKSVNIVWRDKHAGLEVAVQPKKGK
jgi:hypothetical protein